MTILGIKEARFIEETGTLIDLVLETDEGDLPFAYNPNDDAPATEYVREKMGTFPIAAYEPPVVSIEDLRTEKIRSIQRESDKAVAAFTAGYTVGERESFAQQKKGASDILASVESPEAAYVKNLADARVAFGDMVLGSLESVARYEAFAQRILLNALTAEQAIVSIIGKQQGLEVRARLATTPEQLENIVW